MYNTVIKIGFYFPPIDRKAVTASRFELKKKKKMIDFVLLCQSR